MKPMMAFGTFLVGSLVTFGGDPWTSDWTLVTPENGVKDDYYPLPRDAADGSFRFRFSRSADNTIGVEAFVRDDRAVVDDCKPGAVSCTTWTDDCLEVFFGGLVIWSCSSLADRDMTKVVRIQSEEEYN